MGFPAAGTFTARGTSCISFFQGSEMFSLLDWVVNPVRTNSITEKCSVLIERFPCQQSACGVGLY